MPDRRPRARQTLVHGTRQAVAAHVRDAWEQVGRRGLILGPGCVASWKRPRPTVRLRERSAELGRTVTDNTAAFEVDIRHHC